MRPCPAHQRHGTGSNGFTLIEIALAMFVFSIGVLALYALFNTGLQQSQQALADTQIAFFADNVLHGLRAKSIELSETGVSNDWERFWLELRQGVTNITVTAAPHWVCPSSNTFMTIDANGLHINAYTNYALHANRNTDRVHHVLRYLLLVELTNSLMSTPGSNRVNVTLKVWEGFYGSTNDEAGHSFYAQYMDWGGL